MTEWTYTDIVENYCHHLRIIKEKLIEDIGLSNYLFRYKVIIDWGYLIVKLFRNMSIITEISINDDSSINVDTALQLLLLDIERRENIDLREVEWIYHSAPTYYTLKLKGKPQR